MLKQRFMFSHWREVSLGMWLVWVTHAMAHTLPISFLTLVPDENYLHLELTLNPFELTFFSELDANHNGYLEPMDWQGQGEKIAWRILDAVQVRVDGQPVAPDIAGLTQSYESDHITVRAHYAVAARRATVSVESQLSGITSGAHLTQASFGKGDDAQAAHLDAQSSQARFEPIERPVVPDTTATLATLAGSVGQHELAVTLLLSCIASVLLMSMGSVTVLIRHFMVMRSKASLAATHPTTQLR